MDRPRTDLLQVITGPIPLMAYRLRWIVPAVAVVAVGSWFVGLAAILTATH